ncbi:MAG: hypothetical protein RBS13_06945 [Bacteroidales bacterium]|nr:hypothetical protein [Bacteroidales bacterium]
MHKTLRVISIPYALPLSLPIWGDLEGCSLETMMFEKYPSISPYTYCANNPVRGWKTAVIRCFTWKYSIKKMLT